jgi:hypothetical protein
VSITTEYQESTLEQRRARPRSMRIPLLIVAIAVLVGLVAVASYGALSAYAQYRQVRAHGLDGVHQLQHVQALLAPYLRHPAIPDAATLNTVASELTAAEQDFIHTRQDLTAGVFSAAGKVSWAQRDVSAGMGLATAAQEGCLAGLDLIHAAQTLQPVLHSSLVGSQSDATSPLVTAPMLRQVTADIEDAAQHLNTTVADLRAEDGSSLLAQLATPRQRAQLRAVIAQWPHLQAQLAVVDAWLQVAPALLGVSGPERFLVELMDRGEMRSTGGFIGDYGVMTIQGGRMLPFTLTDIQTLDRPYEIRAGWPNEPAAYPWFPHFGFGLRDSNLSPDIPSADQLAIQLLAKEGGPQVQGVVALTAPAIARVLAVVGAVEVPEYHQTVTAQNLELVIRQYTENQNVVYTDQHEQFTGLLGKAFQAKLHGLSASQLAAAAQAILTSLRTKDLQIYMTDPQTEALLAHLGFEDAMAHGPGDAVTIVDANTGVTKANAFTTVTYTDAISLDTRGTATHRLTISYDFNTARDPAMRPYVVAYYYKTYLRVYTPPPARLASFDGFNAGYAEINASDQLGFQMWGGYVLMRDGVPYTLHFTWSVPTVGTKDATGHWRYQVEYQHQAGSDQQLHLTVTTPGDSGPALVYNGALDQDRTFSING